MAVPASDVPWSPRALLVGLLLFVCCAAWCLLVAMPRPRGGKRHRHTERIDLASLAYLLRRRHVTGEDGARWPSLTGKNFVLSVVASGDLDRRRKENLEVLFRSGVLPEGVGHHAYREVTKAALSTRRFSGLTDVAGPAADLGLIERGEPTPMLGIASAGGAYIAYTSGEVDWLNRESLGLDPGDPIVFGTASESPLLRGLSDE